ncbi:hypothetical protein HN51_002944 [Arachis hypogaea]
MHLTTAVAPSPMRHVAPILPASDVVATCLLLSSVAPRPCSPQVTLPFVLLSPASCRCSERKSWSTSPLRSVTSVLSESNAVDRPKLSLRPTN